jgi:hypothetical protein
MVKLFKFVLNGKVIGVTYSDADGNVTPPEGATAVEIQESEKAAAIAQQEIDSVNNPTPEELQEQLIRDRMRELAVQSLQADGSLDSNGIITEAAMTAIQTNIKKGVIQ